MPEQHQGITRTAHDSGDGMTIMHCPFCGGGQVIGRSDGTVECEFCGTAFTVQVQPMYSGFPQSVGGAPFPIPGMPGQIGPAAPAGDPGDGSGNPFADSEQDPEMMQDDQGPDASGNPFAADDGQDAPPDDGSGSGNPFAKKDDGGKPKADKAKGKKKAVRQPPRYATASGAYLSPAAFAEYLAIRHALDAELDPLLERLKAARAA